MDFRAVLLLIIAIAVVWYYFNLATVFWLALLCAFIALLVFIFVILRGEGKIRLITNWLRKTGAKYKKFEKKVFKWLDDL